MKYKCPHCNKEQTKLILMQVAEIWHDFDYQGLDTTMDNLPMWSSEDLNKRKENLFEDGDCQEKYFCGSCEKRIYFIDKEILREEDL